MLPLICAPVPSFRGKYCTQRRHRQGASACQRCSACARSVCADVNNATPSSAEDTAFTASSKRRMNCSCTRAKARCVQAGRHVHKMHMRTCTSLTMFTALPITSVIWCGSGLGSPVYLVCQIVPSSPSSTKEGGRSSSSGFAVPAPSALSAIAAAHSGLSTWPLFAGQVLDACLAPY